MLVNKDIFLGWPGPSMAPSRQGLQAWQPLKLKHCQRHNGPKGRVLLTKVTSLGHITSSNTNLDQTSSKSQPNITFSRKLKLKNLDQTKPESRPRMNFIATTKHQQQNDDQTSASNYCLNINLKILTKP